jgi:enoyl-CoA hydratase
VTALVDYQRRGAVAEIGLNRPEKLNAVNAGMIDELHRHLDTAAADDAVRVLLLHGYGRAFSAGFDLDMGEPQDGESGEAFKRRELKRDFDLIMRVHDFPKPTVAAVHGFCLGSSMELSAVCDLTIASANCRFGAPEVRFGSGMVCLILPWIIGQKHARELLLTGTDQVDAERAATIGLVNRVVADEALLADARAIAIEIAQNDPFAVQMTKRALNESLHAAGLLEALQQALDRDIEIECHESAESREFDRVFKEQGAKAALAWRRKQLQAAN